MKSNLVNSTKVLIFLFLVLIHFKFVNFIGLNAAESVFTAIVMAFAVIVNVFVFDIDKVSVVGLNESTKAVIYYALYGLLECSLAGFYFYISVKSKDTLTIPVLDFIAKWSLVLYSSYTFFLIFSTAISIYFNKKHNNMTEIKSISNEISENKNEITEITHEEIVNELTLSERKERAKNELMSDQFNNKLITQKDIAEKWNLSQVDVSRIKSKLWI